MLSKIKLFTTALLLTAIFLSKAYPYTIYGNGATSERNLPLCGGPREACNIIHNRFWLSPLTSRLCKCSDRSDCPGEWNGGPDKKTIAFNSRAQLKFCTEVSELKQCDGQRTVASEIASNGTINIHCYCAKGHYYSKLYEDKNGQYFACIPYSSCQSEDICGHITSGTYETYHTCTCPPQHICILQDRNLNAVKEFLFTGMAYSGYCIQNNEIAPEET